MYIPYVQRVWRLCPIIILLFLNVFVYLWCLCRPQAHKVQICLPGKKKDATKKPTKKTVTKTVTSRNQANLKQ